MPPTMSEWPLRYLVAECMTRCAPCSSGRCRIGELKVLSTTTTRPRLRAIAAIWAMSTSLSSGLVGVSIQTSLRLGPDRGLERGDVAEVDPAEVQPGGAPAHALEQAVGAAVDVVHAITWLPVSSSSRIVEVAARPEANA